MNDLSSRDWSLIAECIRRVKYMQDRELFPDKDLNEDRLNELRIVAETHCRNKFNEEMSNMESDK